MKYILLLIALIQASCVIKKSGQSSTKTEELPAATAGSDLADPEEIQAPLMELAVDLRKFCRSCHAIGQYRFVRDTDEETVEYIFKERSMLSGNIWAFQIIKALQWPSEVPPPLEARFNENARLMPLGFDRLDFAIGMSSAQIPMRQFIIQTIAAESQRRSLNQDVAKKE